MKTICYLPVLLLITTLCQAQEFNLKFSLSLDDTIGFHAIEWMDADNDGVLDVVGFAKNNLDEEILFFASTDTVNGFSFHRHLNTKVKNAVYLLTDFDGDNSIDVLISGIENGLGVTVAWINKGGFIFERSPVLNESGTAIRYEDLNLDGYRELVLSRGTLADSFTKIYGHSGLGWTVVHDSITVQAHDIKIMDFDGDQDADFFISGKDQLGNVVNRFYYNERKLYFTEKSNSSPVLGSVVSGDLNTDGLMDMVLSGKDAGNVDRTIFFRNATGGFIALDTLTGLRDTEIFAADFNSDGICDLSVKGFKIDNDTVNVVTRGDGQDELFYKDVVKQQFGDFNRDGDLDQLALTNSASGYAFVLHENTSIEKNLPPGPPRSPFSAIIFDRLFMYWERPDDDHTPVPVLTYDVSIQSTGEGVMTAEFDLINGKRLLVSHGNNGATNHSLTKVRDTENLTFNIQSVDNSFHAGTSGICTGRAGEDDPDSCKEFEMVNIDACKNEVITLSVEEGTLWFSFAEGLVSVSAVYSFAVQHPDTLFSFNPQGAGCAIKVFIVSMPTVVKKVTENIIYACAGQTIRAGVEPGWTVEWSSVLQGVLSTEDSIDFQVGMPDTLKVRLSNGTGCDIQRNTAIMISQPALSIADDGYQILKGESVQLSASGGLQYLWTPERGLNRPDIQNPVASPLTTTEYTVTAYDSIGCSSQGRVIVIVEETAFIPNLFTPNEDGKNDALRIYGLGPVSNFSFAVYNREGTLVYDTKNISEITTQGWNGTRRGINLPAGVYHWKVTGEVNGGRRLQLNGKNSGSVVLLR
jgi:gliding motility-associated-like protein